MSTNHTDSGETREIDRSEYGKAPRITPETIEAHISSEHYFTAAEGVIGAEVLNAVPVEMPEALRLLTICVMVLKNGFTVHGVSACASPSNFSVEIGRRVARQDAVNKIWPLLGYMLRDQLHTAANVGDTDVGEALTMMLAHSLGNCEAFKPAHAKAIISQFSQDEGEEGGETKVKFAEQLVTGPVSDGAR